MSIIRDQDCTTSANLTAGGFFTQEANWWRLGGDGNGNGASNYSVADIRNYTEFWCWVSGSEWLGLRMGSSGGGAIYDVNGYGTLLRANGQLGPFNVSRGIITWYNDTDTNSEASLIKLGLQYDDSGAVKKQHLWANRKYVGYSTLASAPNTTTIYRIGGYNGNYSYITRIIIADSITDLVDITYA